jgi:hypothetical protein
MRESMRFPRKRPPNGDRARVAQSDPLAAAAVARQMNEDTIYQSALTAAERNYTGSPTRS